MTSWWISYQTRADGSVLQADVVADGSTDRVCQCVGADCEVLANDVRDGLSVRDALLTMPVERRPDNYCGHFQADDVIFDAGYADGWNEALTSLRNLLTPNV